MRRFFEYFYRSDRKILIIDEFQYLYTVERSWPTVLQRWWERFRETDKKIILCGSIVTTVNRIARGYGSALYGRKTMEMEVSPLRFRHLRDFFPGCSFDTLLSFYGVLGGVPRYLEEFNPSKDVFWNIENRVLDRTSFLYNEPMNLLFEEFRDPAPYVAILVSLARGARRFNEISTRSRLSPNKLPKYLIVLERTGVTGKEMPVTEKKMRTRKTRYVLRDNFFSFWFRFVFPNRYLLEMGETGEVMREIKENFHLYISPMVEGVVIDAVRERFSLPRTGRWWRGENEIDVVGLDEKKKRVLFGEVKWTKRKVGWKIVENLIEKSDLVPVKNDVEKMFLVVSKSGFTDACVRRMEEEGVIYWSLSDLERVVFGDT